MTDVIRHLMQEYLDGQLDETTAEELYEYLDSDSDSAREYARLETVDHLLRHATYARAPQRLAVTIMARLAESIEKEAQLQALPDELQQTVMLSISLVVVSMMPIMVAASHLVIIGMRDPHVLNRIAQRTITLMIMMIDGLIALMDELEHTVHEDPQLAPHAMMLIPITLNAMLDYMQASHMNNDLALFEEGH